MSTTYHGHQSGIVLTSGFAAKNPVTIASDGTVTSGAGYNGDAVYGANYAWTVTNLGTVDATGTASYGIALEAGGSVVNGASGATTALIEGGLGGVSIGGTSGTVVNYGTIEATGTAGTASYVIALEAGGSVVNGASGATTALIEGRLGGVFIGGTSGTVVNYGTIWALYNHQFQPPRAGAVHIGGSGSIVNAGIIRGGLYLDSGGDVVNASTGLLNGRSFISGFAGHVAYVFPAVNISGAAGTVTNLGSITSGVVLASGGEVTNGQSGSPGAFIYGPHGGDYLVGHGVGAAVAISGAGTVTNFATLSGNPGVQISGSGAVANYGVILAPGNILGGHSVPGSYSFGVDLEGGGTLANTGSIAGLGGGVVFSGAGAIANKGTIAGTGTSGFGVYLEAGGITLANRGAISGRYDGIVVGAGEVTGDTLLNTGRIVGGAGGVVMDGPGYLANSGRITATRSSGTGVYLGAGGVRIVNSGEIVGNYGLDLGAGDTAGDTIVNAGTIDGQSGLAVALAAPGDLLVVDPGAVFVGNVQGANSTLELAAGGAAGRLAGLGTNFAGFATVRVDPGASWYVSGGGSAFFNDGTIIDLGELLFGAVRSDPGNRGEIDVGDGSTAEFAALVGKPQTVAFTDSTGAVLLDKPKAFSGRFLGFTEGDVIDLIGKSVDGLSYANHQLVLTEGGNRVADLHFAGHYTASEFALSPDGSGGTDVTLTGAMAAAVFWKISS